MRVIIVGGPIAGLSLAHCLEKARIDNILLEQKEELSPQEAASIGIMPNGVRILEQLGLYDRVEELIEPLSRAHVTYLGRVSLYQPVSCADTGAVDIQSQTPLNSTFNSAGAETLAQIRLPARVSGSTETTRNPGGVAA